MNRRRKIEPKSRNLCCSFILPMVGINHKDLPRNFINSYITEDYKVIMVFDKTEDYDIIFYKFLENTHKKPNLIEQIDEEDEVILKFDIDLDDCDDFDLFTFGKYSRLSESYKKLLINYFGQESIKKDYKASIYNAIKPQDFKRQQIAERIYDDKDIKEGLKLIDEVLDCPNIEEETFKTIEELIQATNKVLT